MHTKLMYNLETLVFYISFVVIYFSFYYLLIFIKILIAHEISIYFDVGKIQN